VEKLARANGLEVATPDNPNAPEFLQRLVDISPDFLFSFYYRFMLSPAVLATAMRGAFNMHGSLLPKFRGRAPVNWAVLKGATETGATLHAMTERADRGAILDQEPVPIGPDDTAIEVQRRVTTAATAVLARRIDDLKSGEALNRAAPQDEAAATRFGRRTPEDGRIDWTRTAKEVHDLVRAVTHPYPGAFTDVFGEKTFVWRSRMPGLAAHDTFPGQVRAEENRLFVACGDDRYLELLRLQPEGAAEEDAGAFIERRGR
jgi:methionyl-tRNA formyltransferase